MQSLALSVVFVIITDYASGEMSERDRNVLDSVKDVDNKTKQEIANLLQTTTDPDEYVRETASYHTVTEFMGIDENGCDTKQKKNLKDKCVEVYEMENEKAQAIEDEKEKTEAVCCALEDYEKCSLRAFDEANCATDKGAIRESMEINRLFHAMNSGIICSEFRDFVCGEISEHDRNVLDSFTDVANKTKQEIATLLENKTDAVEHKWDIVHDLMDGENETDTEFMGIDETGCDRQKKKHFEDRCDEVYEKVNDEAQAIQEEKERTEAVCCALEDYEKCSLRAFDQANCVTDKEAIRENMKAARLFLTVISGITCSEFRGQCAVYHSAAATGSKWP